MTYVKKLVMHGFKSFARKTEILFDNSMNVIVGPNGSGKSNVTDALCFVLGRLSIKSIRAAKAANLLFSGNKSYKGANEAIVELVFDNSNKDFAIDGSEVSIKRIVRKNGQSIYKINNNTKTRQELLELLGHAGIDPNGFNIILQGEIQSLVKATSEERRKILEDVAGISIYETRKEKSLRELEKTEEKLKEVNAVLKERNAFLKNLEKEKQDALNFKKLENTIKQCKKTLIYNEISEKNKELWGMKKIIENNFKEIEKLKLKVKEKDIGIEELQVKISEINENIQKITNNEQDILHKEISNLKAELAGLEVRFENFKNRIKESKEKIEEYNERKNLLEKEINEIKTSSPKIKKKQNELRILQEECDLLEQKRRRFYVLRSDLSGFEHKREERQKHLDSMKKEIESLNKKITDFFNEIKFEKTINSAEELKLKTRHEIEEIKTSIETSEKKVVDIEKKWVVLQNEISRQEKLKKSVLSLNSCPVCKQNVCDEHKKKIEDDASDVILRTKNEEAKLLEKKDELIEQINKQKDKLLKQNLKLSDIEIDIVKLKNADARKEEVKNLENKIISINEELQTINSKFSILKEEFNKLRDVESNYDKVRMKIQEYSFAEIDVDSEVGIKQREISRISVEKKSVVRDLEESEIELRKITILFEDKKRIMNKKEEEEKRIYEKAKKFINDKNEFEDKQKVFETDIIGLQHNIRSFEEKIHNNKIQKAQIDAHLSALYDEIKEFEAVELLKMPSSQLKEKLQNAQFKITQLGNVNLRALETFDIVLEQVKAIEEKVVTINFEKENILKIISEIDKKKKKTFLTTLDEINNIFKRNFIQLFRKGEISLELEDKTNPFEGGVDIRVKFSKGKYFDITSLSGGEKTMIALAFIFAIQEYKPYHFYILDEIDAALDKHNSELLAALIKKYMKTGQYIIVSHNDTLITESSVLYGVSMQENISKIIGLKI